MAVPANTENIFGQSLNDMNQFFSGLRANQAQKMQNQYLPQLLAQQQQQGQQNLDIGAQKLDLARLLQPSTVGTANLGFKTAQDLQPFQVPMAAATLQTSQNTNAAFPAAQKKAALENTQLGLKNDLLGQQGNLMQAGYIPVTNPNTGETTYINSGVTSGRGGTKTFGGPALQNGKIILDKDGKPIATPSTASIAKDQIMNIARKEIEPYMQVLKDGISPYSGLGGKTQKTIDNSAYAAHIATPDQIERLKNEAVAVGIGQTLAGSVMRAAMGTDGTSGDRNDLLDSWGIPRTGGPVVGFSEEDKNDVFDRIQAAMNAGGEAANNQALSPTVTHAVGGTQKQKLAKHMSTEEILAELQGGGPQ